MSAHIVDFTDLSAICNHVYGFAVFLHIQPVTDLHVITISRKLFMMLNIIQPVIKYFFIFKFSFSVSITALLFLLSNFTSYLVSYCRLSSFSLLIHILTYAISSGAEILVPLALLNHLYKISSFHENIHSTCIQPCKATPQKLNIELTWFKYISFNVAISSSPRTEGLTLFAILLTPAG